MKERNIRFQKLAEEDLRFLNETRNMLAEEYLHDSRKFSLEETRRWFASTNPDYYIIKDDETSVGYFRLSNHSKENRNIYIGADIHPDHWGQGIAKTAYRAFMTYLFFAYDLHKISLEVLATNHRAIALYVKLGFVHEGIKRQEVLKGEKYVDSIIMSITKNEWITHE